MGTHGNFILWDTTFHILDTHVLYFGYPRRGTPTWVPKIHTLIIKTYPQSKYLINNYFIFIEKVIHRLHIMIINNNYTEQTEVISNENG